MAAKNRHNAIDCLAAALPDEEYFVLLARDPLAPWVIAIWASMRVGNLIAATENFRLMGIATLEWYRLHPDEAKSQEAIATAERCNQWRAANLEAGPGGTPSWKQSLVRPKLIDLQDASPGDHLLADQSRPICCPVCHEITCECEPSRAMIDELIDAVVGNCDTANLDREKAEIDVRQVLRGYNFSAEAERHD